MNRSNEATVWRFTFYGAEEVNSFLVACRKTGKAMIVDAGGFDEGLIDIAKENKLEINYLLITHHHYDHTEAVPEIIKWKSDIKIIAREFDLFEKVYKHAEACDIQLGELEGEVLHVPGHTNDMLVLHIAGHLFTGDALFAGSVGGTSNSENYNEQLVGIKEKLLTYPPDTIIHPGHGPDSSISLEMRYNPFL